MKNRFLATGYLFVVVGAVMFSSKAVVVKLAFAEGLAPTETLLLRMLFAMPFFFVMFFLAQGRSGECRHCSERGPSEHLSFGLPALG